MDHELENLDQYIDEARSRLNSRHRLRELNHQDNIDYPSEDTLNRLDSSVKKNSAFVKKLKCLNEIQKDTILNEIERLNLNKFISECASSIIEAKYKLSDVANVVEICAKLNQNYKEFSKHLLDQYVRYFPAVRRKNHQDGSTSCLPSTSSLVHVATNTSTNQSNLTNAPSLIALNKIGQSTKNACDTYNLNPSKIRVDLRLFAELIVTGIFPLKDSFPILINLLCYLMFYDKNSHQNASSVLTFCKTCGDELAGLVPRRYQSLAEDHGKTIPINDFVPLKRRALLKQYIVEYYNLLLVHCDSTHNEYNELVAKNNKTYKSKGEIGKDMRELVDNKHSECLKLQTTLMQLAEILGLLPPELPDCSMLKEDCDTEIVSDNHELSLSDAASLSSSNNRNLSIWDDDSSRSFYEDLVDLRAHFPHLVPKTQSDRADKGDQQTKEKIKDEIIAEIPSLEKETPKKGSNLTNLSASIRVMSIVCRSSTPTKQTKDVDQSNKTTLSSSSSEESLQMSENNSPQSNQSNNNSPEMIGPQIGSRVQPESYFSKLSNCVNRDIIDDAAIDFVKFFNTKFGRRRLVKTLFNVQRTRLDLLPFFARLTATLNPVVPTIGNELVSMLKQDFKNLFYKKDQINIESKVKNVRFIGELVKFNLYPKQEALNCLKLLLSDFTHHHIEMTCNLLETCGRLMFKCTDSHHQMRLLLEQMLRKKLHLSVDSKYITMIENAYYFTNPPDVVRQVIIEPPVYIHVRYLLWECLSRSTIDNILEKLKQLDWQDKMLSKFVINCMVEAYNIKFYNIRYLAALLAALNKEHQWISIAVIDGVVEDILLMVEVNEIQFNQRRIPMMRYFGELFNYRLSDSSLVFKILYSLITYGVYYPEPKHTLTQIPMSRLDLPDNLFRIKLICDLLDTCGQFLNNGQDKKKLDCYLLFFQRYYWCKKHIYMLTPYCIEKSGGQFPASIEYMYDDTIHNLRPSFRMASSYSDAIEATQNFLNGLSAAAAATTTTTTTPSSSNTTT